METTSALFELATVSLACRDRDTFLKTFSARVGAELGARTVLVWLANPGAQETELVCRARWSEPGERFTPIEEPSQDGLLADVWKSRMSRRISGRDGAVEKLAHLDEGSRSRVKSAAYASIRRRFAGFTSSAMKSLGHGVFRRRRAVSRPMKL